MANRSFTKDVLQALHEIDQTFVGANWLDPKGIQAALSQMWRIVGGLEAVALRRASSAEKEAYMEAVVYPRAKRSSEMLAELVPVPRTDKDGVPW